MDAVQSCKLTGRSKQNRREMTELGDHLQQTLSCLNLQNTRFDVWDTMRVFAAKEIVRHSVLDDGTSLTVAVCHSLHSS